ncbi:MAG: hypothetical protein JXR64_05335 [Spirochaetales bacterium]|nr:hypothetical protein [Spirochaetales bacterium]
MRINRILIFCLIFISVSCKTNKRPLWIDNPPPNDELNIYIVAFGSENRVLELAVDALFKMLELQENSYLKRILLNELELSYKKSVKTDASVIDSWISDDKTTYILTRFSRKRFDSMFTLYKTQIDEIESYINVFEESGDLYYLNGEYYAAYLNYIESIDEMIGLNDEFYTMPIIRLLGKLTSILQGFEFYNIETFSLLKTGEKTLPNRLFFNVKSGYNGFIYTVAFQEDSELRSRVAHIPISNNQFEFIPAIPRISLEYNIGGNLDFPIISSKLVTWESQKNLSLYINDLRDTISSTIKKSSINFNYSANYAIGLEPKLVALENEYLKEGLFKAFNLNNIEVVELPVPDKNTNPLLYYRGLRKDSNEFSRYIIIEDDLQIANGNILFKYSILDLQSEIKIYSNLFSTTYNIDEEELNSKLLEVGEAIGNELYSLKF